MKQYRLVGLAFILVIGTVAAYADLDSGYVAPAETIDNWVLYVTSGDILNDGTVNNHVTFENEHALTNNGTIDNTGDLKNNNRLTSTGTLTNQLLFLNTSLLDISSAGTLTNTDSGIFENMGWMYNQGGVVNQGTFENKRDLTNNGTVTNSQDFMNFSGASLYNNNSFTNDDTLTNEGYLQNDGTLDDFGVFQNSGQLFNGGTLRASMLTSNGLVNNYGSLENMGNMTNNNLFINSNEFINLNLFLNSSVFTNKGTGVVSSVIFENSGLVQNDGSFTVYTDFDNTGGVLVNDGTFTTRRDVTLGGEVSGSGTFVTTNDALFTFDGLVRPGNSPGTMTLNGDAAFADTNTLAIELGGFTPDTEYDVLSVIDGSLAIDGILDLDLYGGFSVDDLVGGETFDIITADEESWLTGEFSGLDSTGAALLDGLYWDIAYGFLDNGVWSDALDPLLGQYSNVRLIVEQGAAPVPEPAGMMMLGCLGAGMLLTRRIRRGK